MKSGANAKVTSIEIASSASLNGKEVRGREKKGKVKKGGRSRNERGGGLFRLSCMREKVASNRNFVGEVALSAFRK